MVTLNDARELMDSMKYPVGFFNVENEETEVIAQKRADMDIMITEEGVSVAVLSGDFPVRYVLSEIDAAKMEFVSRGSRYRLAQLTTE
jgi:hypothetical protein